MRRYYIYSKDRAVEHIRGSIYVILCHYSLSTAAYLNAFTQNLAPYSPPPEALTSLLGKVDADALAVVENALGGTKSLIKKEKVCSTRCSALELTFIKTQLSRVDRYIYE